MMFIDKPTAFSLDLIILEEKERQSLFLCLRLMDFNK